MKIKILLYIGLILLGASFWYFSSNSKHSDVSQENPKNSQVKIIALDNSNLEVLSQKVRNKFSELHFSSIQKINQQGYPYKCHVILSFENALKPSQKLLDSIHSYVSNLTGYRISEIKVIIDDFS